MIKEINLKSQEFVNNYICKCNNNNNEIIKEEEPEKEEEKDEEIKEWKLIIKEMKKNGFTNCCIVDIKSSDIIKSSNKEFKISYCEFQEILNLFNGQRVIAVSIDGERYFISRSDDIIINGSSTNGNSKLSIIIHKTNSKCIIGIYGTGEGENKLTNQLAEDLLISIMDSTNLKNKNEFISNLIE